MCGNGCEQAQVSTPLRVVQPAHTEPHSTKPPASSPVSQQSIRFTCSGHLIFVQLGGIRTDVLLRNRPRRQTRKEGSRQGPTVRTGVMGTKKKKRPPPPPPLAHDNAMEQMSQQFERGVDMYDVDPSRQA